MAESIQPVRVHLYETKGNNWSTDTLFAVPSITLYAAAPALPFAANPYSLPVTNGADIAVVTTNFDDALVQTVGLAGAVLFYQRIRQQMPVAALDTHDTFAPGFRHSTVAHFDLILKTQGIFRNREEYLKYPSFGPDVVSRIRRSFPCFIAIHPEIRRKVRIARKQTVTRRIAARVADRLAEFSRAWVQPAKNVFFAGALNHLDRLKIIVNTTFPPHSTIQVSRIPEQITTRNGKLMDRTDPEVQQLLIKWEKTRSIARMNRYRFLFELLRHKVVLSPAGHGELAFRHGEALSAGRVLLCEDLSHVDTGFDLRHGVNAIFYDPTETDLSLLLNSLVAGDQHTTIAERGLKEWNTRMKDAGIFLHETVTVHLLESITKFRSGQ